MQGGEASTGEKRLGIEVGECVASGQARQGGAWRTARCRVPRRASLLRTHAARRRGAALTSLRQVGSCWQVAGMRAWSACVIT